MSADKQDLAHEISGTVQCPGCREAVTKRHQHRVQCDSKFHDNDGNEIPNHWWHSKCLVKSHLLEGEQIQFTPALFKITNGEDFQFSCHLCDPGSSPWPLQLVEQGTLSIQELHSALGTISQAVFNHLSETSLSPDEIRKYAFQFGLTPDKAIIREHEKVSQNVSSSGGEGHPSTGSDGDTSRMVINGPDPPENPGSPLETNLVEGEQQNAVISEKEVSGSSSDQLLQSYLKIQNDLIRDQQRRLQEMVDENIRKLWEVFNENIRKSQEIFDENNRKSQEIVDENIRKLEAQVTTNAVQANADVEAYSANLKEEGDAWRQNVLHGFGPFSSTVMPGLNGRSMPEGSSLSSFSEVTAESEDHQIQHKCPVTDGEVSQKTEYQLCRNDSELNSPGKEGNSPGRNLETTEDVFTAEMHENSDFKLVEKEVSEQLGNDLHTCKEADASRIGEDSGILLTPDMKDIIIPFSQPLKCSLGHQEKPSPRKPRRETKGILAWGGSKQKSSRKLMKHQQRKITRFRCKSSIQSSSVSWTPHRKFIYKLNHSLVQLKVRIHAKSTRIPRKALWRSRF